MAEDAKVQGGKKLVNWSRSGARRSSCRALQEQLSKQLRLAPERGRSAAERTESAGREEPGLEASTRARDASLESLRKKLSEAESRTSKAEQAVLDRRASLEVAEDHVRETSRASNIEAVIADDYVMATALE